MIKMKVNRGSRRGRFPQMIPPLAASVAVVIGLLSVGVGTAAAAGATTTQSTWVIDGYDTGRSSWDSQEHTVTPAEVKIMKLNFTIPTAPYSDPSSACPIANGPVTAAGHLFAVGPDGISAYNQWSGQRLWNVDPPSFYGSMQYYTSLMQVVGADLVVVLTDCLSASSAGSTVFVLKVTTGAQVQTPWTPSAAVRSMAVTNGTLVTSETNDATSWVRGYSLAGKQLWTTASGWGGPYGLPMPVAKGLAYVQDPNSNLAALRIADGSVAWLSAGLAPVAVSQDGAALYTVSGTNLYVINPTTGAFTGWEAVGRGSNNMAVDSTAVYSACAGTALCATRRSDGHSLWTVSAGGSGQPIVALGVVYFAGRTFLATSGARIKSAADGTTITAVAGGRVYGLKDSSTTGLMTAIVSYK